MIYENKSGTIISKAWGYMYLLGGFVSSLQDGSFFSVVEASGVLDEFL